MEIIPKSLEDQFFYDQDLKLIEKQRALKKMKATAKAIKEVSGINNEAVLQKLVELNIQPETVASLAVLPLVEVAWANGEIGNKEKLAVLTAINNFGWAKNSVDYILIERWLEHKPEAELLNTWVHYIENICAKMQPTEVLNFKTEIMLHAKAVAGASGGILGIGNISQKENEMLKKIENAFNIINEVKYD